MPYIRVLMSSLIVRMRLFQCRNKVLNDAKVSHPLHDRAPLEEVSLNVQAIMLHLLIRYICHQTLIISEGIEVATSR